MKLSKREIEILHFFEENAGRAIPYGEMQVKFFKEDSSANIMELCISRLRKKVSDNGLIASVRKIGYIYLPLDEAAE